MFNSWYNFFLSHSVSIFLFIVVDKIKLTTGLVPASSGLQGIFPMSQSSGSSECGWRGWEPWGIPEASNVHRHPSTVLQINKQINSHTQVNTHTHTHTLSEWQNFSPVLLFIFPVKAKITVQLNWTASEIWAWLYCSHKRFGQIRWLYRRCKNLEHLTPHGRSKVLLHRSHCCWCVLLGWFHWSLLTLRSPFRNEQIGSK